MDNPTPEQLRLFERSKESARALNMEANALRYRAECVGDAVRIASQYSVQIPGAFEYIQKIQSFIERDQRIQKTIGSCITGTLGIRTSSQMVGDLDIMAPPGTSDDVLNQYYRRLNPESFEFGLPPWLIIIGVVVVVGILAALAHEHEQAGKLRNQYKPLMKKADELLCSNPSDPKCLAWKQEKQKVSFTERQGFWERLENGAADILRKLSTGAQWGLAIAIPAVAAFLIWSWSKKER